MTWQRKMTLILGNGHLCLSLRRMQLGLSIGCSKDTVGASRNYRGFSRKESLSTQKRPRNGARPLYFQRQSCDSNPYGFAGSARILPPDKRHLSACLGAALASSPLLGNLMRLGQGLPRSQTTGNSKDARFARLLTRIGFLSNQLFFQLIRESPIHGVRNKSMPAYYLTPEIIGCLVGYSQEQKAAPIRKLLREHFGIRSNRIYETEWTGISMARWMDLVEPVTNSSLDDSYHDYDAALLSCVWSIALWGTVTSKESWMKDYVKGLKYAGVVHTREEWEDFSREDLTRESLRNAMDVLIDFYGGNQELDPSIVSRSLELVCAAIVLQQSPHLSHSSLQLPSPIPNGYYAPQQNGMTGPPKANCAEVTVQEILMLLLWNEAKGCIDASRLPPKASRNLSAVLQSEENSGQLWFDLLSNLPECEYLAMGSTDEPSNNDDYYYELAPTVESISKALWHLLDDSDLNSTPWTSLEDLADFWNSLPNTLDENKLRVRVDRLRHHVVSEGETLQTEHEFVVLQLAQSPRGIEVRMRCDRARASGMAAVTHLIRPRKELLLDPTQVQTLFALFPTDPSWWMLCLALQSEYEFDYGSFDLPDSLLWLGSAYGPDRRELGIDGNPLRLMDDLLASRALLTRRILEACRLSNSYPESSLCLLSWILDESPTVVESSSKNGLDDRFREDKDRIVDALICLPKSILDDSSILESIRWNWACVDYGTALVRMIQWRTGKISIFEVLRQSSVSEIPDLVSLYQRIQSLSVD